MIGICFASTTPFKKQEHKPGEFLWRSTSVTRLEGFSDAVFAFAITLLVVSLEVPRTFDHLIQTMKGFVAFAISFTFLIGPAVSIHATLMARARKKMLKTG